MAFDEVFCERERMESKHNLPQFITNDCSDCPLSILKYDECGNEYIACEEGCDLEGYCSHYIYGD